MIASVCLLSGAGTAGAVLYLLEARDAVLDMDRALYRDVTPHLAAGDMNGDGIGDVAVEATIAPGSPTEIDVVLGGSAQASLTADTTLRVLLPIGAVSHALVFADLNHDGKDDLIAAANDAPWEVAIFWGSSQLERTVDLSVSTPDAWLPATGSAQYKLATGDFNNDGIADVALGNKTKEVIVIFGRSDFSVGMIDRGDPTRIFRVIGPTLPMFGDQVVKGDVNGDGTDDLILSSFSEVFVIWGSTGLAGVWDLSSTPASVRIGSGSSFPLRGCPAAGDFDGDGKDDLLLIGNSSLLAGPRLMLLYGDLASPPGGVLSLDPIPPGALVHPGVSSFHVFADFDGDGRDDLILANSNATAALTTDHAARPTSLDFTSLVIAGGFTAGSVGSINGDSNADLLLFSNGWLVGSSFYGARVDLFFGFQPLKDPTLQLEPDSASSKWSMGRFSVRGVPTEMKLSGDLVESEKDRWIPFAPAKRIELSSATGPKTVEVVYRNALGRLSDPVVSSTTLSVAQELVRVSSNRVGPGGRARWEVSLSAPGHIKATVFSAQGQEVSILEDSEHGAGVWALEWDGANASGRRVAPGHYLLRVETAGRIEKLDIAVTAR